MPPKRIPRTNDQAPRTNCIVFPFDLFGNAGTGAGAQLLGDVLQEAIDDTAAESRPTRPAAFTKSLTIEEYRFETMEQVTNWRATGRSAIRKSLTDANFTLWLTGNHLGVLPVYEELGRDGLVIQFDAHLDCYALHDTTEELSHGNWLLHAETALPRIVNVGHRDLFLTDADIRQSFAATFPIDRLVSDTDRVHSELKSLSARPKRVWLDLDMDVFDPAFAPAVHQPTPVGLTPQQFLAIISAIGLDHVVGLSISEYDPGRDVGDRTLMLLDWLVEWMLLRKRER